MRQVFKRLVKGALSPLGVEVRRTDDRRFTDPFWVQSQLIKNNHPVIFDVGANVGQTSLVYGKLFPDSVIHAFEPFPESFAKLEAQFRGNSSVTLNKLAVSDTEGSVTMNANAASVTNSLLKTDPRGAETWGENLLDTLSEIQVPMTTIDAYCSANSIGNIDILKLDIQGAELRALKGAKSLLTNRRISLVYMELILAPTYREQPSFEDYLSYFHSVGYSLLDMYNPFRKDLHMIQADIIWIPGR